MSKNLFPCHKITVDLTIRGANFLKIWLDLGCVWLATKGCQAVPPLLCCSCGKCLLRGPQFQHVAEVPWSSSCALRFLHCTFGMPTTLRGICWTSSKHALILSMFMPIFIMKVYSAHDTYYVQ
jgi:hypothetical protein